MKPATAASQGTAKLAELLRSQNLVNEQQLSAVLGYRGLECRPAIHS